jgi:O-antigen/teichoic acid export membrane protein
MYMYSRRMSLNLPYRLTYDAESFRRMRTFGFYSFVINLCGLVIFYTDNLIVGRAMGAIAVTYFAIGASLVPYMDNLVLGMSAQLQQVAVGYDAKGQSDSMRAMFFDGSRYLFALTCLLFANIAVVGPDFIGVWMGEKYVSGEGLGLSGTVLIILGAAHVFHNLPTVARQILFGMQKNNLLALTSSIDAIAKIILSLVLVRTHGLVGVAVGTFIPMCLVSGVAVPVVVCRLLAVRARDFFYRAVAPNLLATGLSVGGAMLALRWAGLNGWLEVFVGAGLVSALHAASVWMLVLTPTARTRFIGMVKSRLSR